LPSGRSEIFDPPLRGQRFTADYERVKRFISKLRGSTTPEPRVVTATASGEEAQVDYRSLPRPKAVRVFDYVDAQVLMLGRMYEKRLKGYRAICYEVESQGP
jgi:hypothetical protein